jgi:hypothetical protein
MRKHVANDAFVMIIHALDRLAKGAEEMGKSGGPVIAKVGQDAASARDALAGAQLRKINARIELTTSTEWLHYVYGDALKTLRRSRNMVVATYGYQGVTLGKFGFRAPKNRANEATSLPIWQQPDAEKNLQEILRQTHSKNQAARAARKAAKRRGTEQPPSDE